MPKPNKNLSVKQLSFKSGSRRKPIEYEKDLIQYWKNHKTFEKSVEQRPKPSAYVFYDGPPFITGVPHHGTLLSSIVKDAVPRYWTMKGKRVERVWGWDCHGLPAENYVERKLGIKDKRDVYKIGLEKYINTCRQSMVQTGSEWEDTIDRVGRWVDFQGAYKTMDKDYMESVWWAFKELYDAGRIYEGEKVLMYCTRCATPIAKAEVAMDNSYQEVTDPSVYVKFKLKGEDKYLLVWTTTPWTLPANTAAAVNKSLEYAEVKVGKEIFILASQTLKKALQDDKKQELKYELITKYKGSKLVGKEYEPLFKSQGKGAHRVYHADYVNLEEGTGIVHLAPAYGEEDYELAIAGGFPHISVIDEHGIYTDGDWTGEAVWDVNKQIAKDLQAKGVVWRIEYVKHSYPHCHRCGTKLMYRAHPSWFMKIDDQKEAMLKQNEPINWFPSHFKNGRFANNIKQAPDWNISRDRFWATAFPVWKGKDQDGKEHVKVVGSYQELKELSGVELEDYHRPWIDDVTFEIDGIKYERIDKVFDSWFEAAAMPFAQFHYPFVNEEKFEANFPGDFIAEYVGQVRAWFYYLHALSVGLFKKNSFKNVIVTGTIAGNDGRKMSKNYGNYTDPNELMDKYSADALRFLFLSSPLLNGEDYSLIDKDVADVSRKLAMIWNMYDFFTLYASVDGWVWNGDMSDPSKELDNLLDKWIVSRVHQLNVEIDQNMQAYNIPAALKPVIEFIEDASNWYVRRSRKRFWKSEDDEDKQNAYRTLHYVLVYLSQILAPFVPFLAEELYQKLTGGESVHLLDWPTPSGVTHIEEPKMDILWGIDENLIRDMRAIREIIAEGLKQRADAGIKVRQPLAKVTLSTTKPQKNDNLASNKEFQKIIAEELNVHEVAFKQPMKERVVLDTTITPALKKEGLAREIIRHIQQYRKESGLEVDDRIELKLYSPSAGLTAAIETHQDEIKAETLAVSLDAGTKDMPNAKTASVDGEDLQIILSKSKDK